MPKKELPPSRIPEALLKQINEHTQGGFVILFVNNQGQPSVTAKFDTLIQQMGMYQFALDYFQSINNLQSEQTSQICQGLANVTATRDDEPAEEEGDEDEDDGEEDDGKQNA
jgi:hypothetical protein